MIDGDTLELTDGRRVRLIGIDTPEMGRRGEPAEPFAQAAKKRLQQLVEASGLRMYTGEEPSDRYGRILAHLHAADGSNIEAQMLKEGLGFALVVPPNDAMADCHGLAERQARSLDRGIWSRSPVIRASALEEGGFTIIKGRVESASEGGGHLWLDLDGPVTLRIGRDEREAFDANLIEGSPRRWVGRHVEARGWVVDRQRKGQSPKTYKRFMLPVRHPFMLEID
ncbi:thermonuclease family protein [Halopseudomonas salina]|uniref:Nuclease n=1 Tax=Halopseudomonas salina TaxID=1323744 RepID=A0ABQ1PFW2_9GAMM|nr:thermonuclease family protein [Halopseudomonas salina]GGC96452.1 nuclease [Halopseudomonas salina]